MTQIWDIIRQLSDWQLLTAVSIGILALISATRLIIAQLRGRDRTVYVLDESGKVIARGRGIPGASTSSIAKGRRPLVPGERALGTSPEVEATTDDAPVADEEEEGGSGDYLFEPHDESWTAGRVVCPCCGYPTDYPYSPTCSLCDWEEPRGESPEWRVARSEREAMLSEARASFIATGSAITEEERASWGGELTARELELRHELRAKLDYLRSGNRPDTFETWELVDALLFELEREARDKVRDDDA